ncbi:hypothetical protein EYR40_008725 [Pleurotus pulmonarius]|nr:hypothetical protein EYR36_009547 [Pleurotus pulmonarius]KAF4593928.1 hypothetical protein EYR40_008725 [Pleurotus pulmonarius]
MSIYSGKFLGTGPQVLGTILCILPKVLDPGNSFIVLASPFTSPEQQKFGISRFDVAIESSSSFEDAENNDKELNIVGIHAGYRFTLETSATSLSMSIALSFGELAPLSLKLLTTYPDADTLDNLVVYASHATASDKPRSSLVVLLPREAIKALPNGRSFLALFLPPSDGHTSPVAHPGLLSCDADEDATERLQVSFSEGDTTFSGTVGLDDPSLLLNVDGLSNYTLDVPRLERSWATPINLISAGALTTIQSDVDEIVRCSLRETGTPDWQTVTEATIGFGVGGVSMLTASASVAAALPPTVPVVLGVIGLILASRSLYQAVKPLESDVARALYPKDWLSRQSEKDNDVFLMRAHMIGGDLRLVINTYEVLEVGAGNHTVTSIIKKAEDAKKVVTLFNFVLAVPQKLSLFRGVAIPSLVPTKVSPTLTGDVKGMSGGLATFTKDGTATYYAPIDLFGTIPNVTFKYSPDQSSYMIQQGSNNPGNGNTITPLPTACYSVLKLQNMIVSGADAGTQLLGTDPISIINLNPDFWAYSTVTVPHSGTAVVGYKTPGQSTLLKPQVGTDSYFVMKDWCPYQAFVPAS